MKNTRNITIKNITGTSKNKWICRKYRNTVRIDKICRLSSCYLLNRHMLMGANNCPPGQPLFLLPFRNSQELMETHQWLFLNMSGLQDGCVTEATIIFGYLVGAILVLTRCHNEYSTNQIANNYGGSKSKVDMQWRISQPLYTKFQGLWPFFKGRATRLDYCGDRPTCALVVN